MQQPKAAQEKELWQTPLAFHTFTMDRLLSFFQSDVKNGLTGAEAERRLTICGKNELTKGKSVSPWEVLFSQFKNVLIVILLVAIVLSAVLGHQTEAIAIAVIVLFSVLLGFMQEYRAERAIEALRELTAPIARVRRNGEETSLPARDIVPGDILLLATGDRLPADGRIIESVSLHVDEAALTGESVPVQKQIDVLQEEKLPIGDRRNMVYAGTAITYGHGIALVTATGMQTEFGMIAGMLQNVETRETPLQKELDSIGAKLAKGAFGIIAMIVILGMFRGQAFLDMFIFGVALAVAVVPEALPAVVTISLAIGVQRMAKRHALIRKLPAVETLGSTTIICSDKTGTLTKDEMTIRRIVTAGGTVDVSGTGYDPHGAFSVNGKRLTTPDSFLRNLLRAGTLASDSTLVQNENHEWTVKGDPTEGAIVVAAAKAGLQKSILDGEEPRIAEIPFSSESKRMTTLHRRGNGTIAYAKGAPEVLLASCIAIRGEHGTVPLTEERRKSILNDAHAMAEEALRVLLIACKEVATIATAENDLTFLGLVGMIDPPRPEAKAAIEQCHEAGIRVIMITGDHPVTAKAVGRELGLLKSEKIVTGPELEEMTEQTLEKNLQTIDGFARVSPVHKLRIVTALQKHGHIVAMTGDGVNDAPALKKADIGIAMGITGTEVTKEAAAMMLTDDNFASIVAAVEEGRGIFGNITKYLVYLLSTNIGEMLLIVGASLAGLPLPLSAVQILYVNLATDGLPALALAVDPPEKDLMHIPPRNTRKSIFTWKLITLMSVGSLWTAIVTITLYYWADHVGHTHAGAMTMAFLALILIQFCNAYCFRSDRHSVFVHPFANKWLNTAIIWELFLLTLIILVPALRSVLSITLLPLRDVALVILFACSVIPVLEIAKRVLRSV